MGPNFRFSAADSVGPTTATRRMRLLVLLMPAFSCGLCHGLLTLVRCPVALESATFLALLALVVHFYSIVWVTLCWILSAGALVLLALFQLRLLFSFHVNTSVLGTLFPSVDVLVGFYGGSLFAALSIHHELLLGFWFWQLPVSWFCFSLVLDCMLCCLKFKCLHSMLLLSCLSTSHGLRRLLLMLCSVQFSFQLHVWEVLSIFILLFSAAYYHHGVPMPIQRHKFLTFLTSPDIYSRPVETSFASSLSSRPVSSQ